MKIRPFIFFLFLLFPSFGFAQQVESMHSIKAGIRGVTYSYEHAIGKQITINLETGANWGWQYSDNNFEINFSPIFILEPRLYYSVKRRFKVDRFTNNSASFFSLAASYESAILKNYGSGGFSVIPKWGFRRAIGKHFIFEAQIGGGLWFGPNSHRFNPALDIKFGYVF